MRVERPVVEPMPREDGSEQEGAEGAPFLVGVDGASSGRNELGEGGLRPRQPQDGVVDEQSRDGVGLAAKNISFVGEGRVRQADNVGVNPAAACHLDHPVAKHVGEGGDRRLAVGGVAPDEGFVGAYQPGVLQPDARRDIEPRIVAVEAQAGAGPRKRREARVGERIELTVPERSEFAAFCGGRLINHAGQPQFIGCEASLDPRENIAAGLFPVAEERLGRQIAPRHELAINVENPAGVDVVQQQMPSFFPMSHPDAVGHIGEADLARVAAVDVQEVEFEFIAAAGEPWQNLARIAGKRCTRPGNSPLRKSTHSII